jgi:hypothetical protein
LLISREERRLRVLEYRVPRRILGFKRKKVTREWRKLHNEELNDLSSPHNIVWAIKLRSMRWAGHVARMRERRGVCRGLVGKPEGKRPLGWKDYINIDLQEVGCEGMD